MQNQLTSLSARHACYIHDLPLETLLECDVIEGADPNSVSDWDLPSDREPADDCCDEISVINGSGDLPETVEYGPDFAECGDFSGKRSPLS